MARKTKPQKGKKGTRLSKKEREKVLQQPHNLKARSMYYEAEPFLKSKAIGPGIPLEGGDDLT